MLQIVKMPVDLSDIPASDKSTGPLIGMGIRAIGR